MLDRVITRETVTTIIDPNSWRSYRKKRFTHATRIKGPFTVKTREGTLTCKDGYLALDSEDYPYPIAKEEFEKIYELAVILNDEDRGGDKQ